MPKLTAADLERVCHMLTKEYGVRVVIGGDRCRTDGKGVIFLPTLPEIENETLLSVCRFFLDHEAAHIVGKSEFEARGEIVESNGQAAGMILEALEDLRCERLMSDLWAGCGVNIRRGGNEVLNHLSDDDRMAGTRDVPAFQLMTGIYAAGHDHAIPEWVDPKLGALVETFTDEIKATAKSATSTRELLDLTRRIFDAAQLEMDEPPTGQPQAGDGEKSEGECDKNGQGQSGDSEPDKQDENDDQGQGEGQGQQDQEDGDEGDDNDDEREDEEATASSNAKDSSAGEGQVDNQSPPQDENDADEKDAESDVDGGTSDNTGGGPGGKGADLSPGSNDLNDIGDVDMDSITDSAAKTVGDELAAMVKEHGAEAMSRPMVPELDVIERFDPEASPIETREFAARAKKSGGPMRQKLAQMLLSEAKCWYRGGLKKGSPDPRRLAALVCGTTDRPMRRKFVRPAANTACALLIDGSGSMGVIRMSAAMLAGAAFSAVLEAAGHKSSMALFDSHDGRLSPAAMEIIEQVVEAYEKRTRDENQRDDDGDVKNRYDMERDLGLRLNGVRLRVVKGWNEQVIRCYPRMTAAQHAASGGTPMGEAMLLAAKDLIARKEKRKVMMVFTDGIPDCPESVRIAERGLRRAEIEVVLIGILHPGVQRLTDNYAIVNDLNNLGAATMDQLRKALHPGGRR